MTTEVTREEHQHLVTRVDVLEREVEGEKMVTRHILEETRHNSDDLAVIKTRLDRMDAKVASVEANLTQEIRRLGATLQDLVRTLPQIVSEAVRQASPKRSKR
jgi:tetrahydromethanopterin S-methyltransferase subunit G